MSAVAAVVALVVVFVIPSRERVTAARAAEVGA
jgi:hypothetical protein